MKKINIGVPDSVKPYLNEANNQDNTLTVRLFNMKEAYNHVCNALYAAQGRLNESETPEDALETIEELKRESTRQRHANYKLSEDRIEVQRKAQEAVDSPDHVWANQRRVMRKELEALRSGIAYWHHRATCAEEILRAVINPSDLSIQGNYTFYAMPSDLKEKVIAYMKEHEMKLPTYYNIYE